MSDNTASRLREKGWQLIRLADAMDAADALLRTATPEKPERTPLTRLSGRKLEA